MGGAKEREAARSYTSTIQTACDELGASGIITLVDEWVIGYTNAYRDRYIIKSRLIDGIPYCLLIDKVEAEFGQPITERQLRRIVSKGIKLLRKHGL